VGSARRAPVDQSGITPDHPLDGPHRRTPPSSCISRFDFRELKVLLFHGACRRARARVGGAGARCGCPIEPGDFACAPPWLLWRGWRSRQRAQPLLRATRAPRFRDFLTRAPCVFTGVQGAKLGPVAGCMDEPLASPRWAYAFVWLLRPTSRRGAGVEASGGEVVGCRFCSKSHCAQTARAGPEKFRHSHRHHSGVNK
jgi:hypothetical protein